MKMIRFFLMFFAFALIYCCGSDEMITPGENNPEEEESPFAIDIGDSEIPYVIVRTNGESILNEPKVPAEMEIYQEGELIQTQSIGIEFRGSTSFRLSDKKSFGIETWDANGNDVDVSFFGFPEEEDWALIGHVVNNQNNFVFDRTLMYHYLAYELYRNLGRYSSRTQFVELQIDEQYLGIYIFLEKLKRDKNRIDVARLEPTENDGEDLTGGYILKIDKTSGGDHTLNQPLEYFLNNWQDDALYTPEVSFRSAYDINGNVIDFEAFGPPYHDAQYLETYFVYEYPRSELITEQQKNYISNYINEFETALINDDLSSNERTYLDFIDEASFVDFFLVNEMCRNVDGYRLSTYLHKDRGGELALGPVWDFNIGFDNADRIPFDDWVIRYNNYVNQDPWMMPFWWDRFMDDPIFKSLVKERWQALRASTFSDQNVLSIINTTQDYLVSNGAMTRNANKWPPLAGVSYDDSVESLRSFMINRMNWMDSEIASF